MARSITIPEETYTEEIQHYTTYYDGAIGVCIGRGTIIPEDTDRGTNESFKFESSNTIRIDGDDLEALLSDNPSWHRGKKGHSFEKNDLWYAIDAKRKGIPLEKGSEPGAKHSLPLQV